MNHHQQPQEQQQQTGSGLARYRSAPSSYFSTLFDANNCSSLGGFETEDFSPETQRIFSGFMNSSDNIQPNSTFLPPRKGTGGSSQLQRQKSCDYSSVSSQMMYQNHSSQAANSVMDNSSNRLLGSISSNRVAQIKMEGCGLVSGGGGGNSSLIRHSSSPAGLFASINIENGIMAPISEISSKGLGDTSPGDTHFDDDHADYNEYIQGRFSSNSWDDSDIMSDNFLNPNKNVNPLDGQNNDIGNRPTTLLSHHLSLPKSSAELSAMEKLLQDSVPCRIRAKRGCATHPRSIAERVRRTKISERMRKLQELVPNMEKQTNTSDMLDLAVDYIKDLQTQVKMLSDNSAKCTCFAKKRP